MSITRQQRAQLGRLLRGGHITQAIELGQALTEIRPLVLEAINHAISGSGAYWLHLREKRWCIEWATLPPFHADSKTRFALIHASQQLRRLRDHGGSIDYCEFAKRRRLFNKARGLLAGAALTDLSLGREIPLNVAGYLAVCSQSRPKHPRLRRFNTVLLDALCGDLGWLDAYTQVPLSRGRRAS
ncbi:MAG: hypothetical protein AAFV53_00435 [Myxococcota bacterium]